MGLIIFTLREGELYFRELEKAIPALSARVLTQRIRELEASGLVTRHVSQAPPVRVSYSLTEKGKSLAVAVGGIADWAKT
jgi:DNA-binding HxlR family transcriptional regulator